GASVSTAPAIVLTVLTGPGFAGDVFAKFARRLPGNLAKGQGKGAVKGVAESQCDIRDRIRSIRQQHLRPLHAPLKKMSLRWNSTGLLEGSTEMMLACPREPDTGDDRYSLVQVFFHITHDSTSLPAGKAAATRW